MVFKSLGFALGFRRGRCAGEKRGGIELTTSLTLKPGELSLADLRSAVADRKSVKLDDACWPAVDRSAETVAQVIRDGRTVYGINTGFGKLASTRISDSEIEDLQRRLVLSHAAGTGAPLADDVVHAILLLKINSLARGHSGLRREVIEALLTLLNARAYPVVPGQGSVGASGDLAPLAHVSAALLGEGEIRLDGELLAAGDALHRVGLAPLTLGAKEGLALLNGTQVSTALAAAGLFAAEDVFAAALAAGALSVDAALASDVPFDDRIHAVRGQPGQTAVAAVLARLLDGSEIRESHIDCDRVQDPYSLRCQPQVMGACLDHMAFAAGVIHREMNGVSDNPLVFAETGDILSGGNFHAEPVAMAADTLALVIAEVGAISERRVALLTDANISELPAFLVADPGLNSGFMIAHVTAAALVAENKLLASPASVDSLPTSANQEDHVSMAAHGARRLLAMAENAAAVVAIELLAAAQGVDFRRPKATGAILRDVMERVRAEVPFFEADRLMAPEIEAAKRLVASGWFRGVVPLAELPSA